MLKHFCRAALVLSLCSALASASQAATLETTAEHGIPDVCLTWSPAVGAQVYASRCNGASTQYWELVRGNIEKRGGPTLDVSGGHATDGTPIIVSRETEGAPNQKWSVTTGGRIVGIGGKCLGLGAYDPAIDGYPVVLQPCSDFMFDQWLIE